MPLELRPACLEERPEVYRMMANSDATAEMMGPPNYCDHPVPDYGEFCDDYDEEAFATVGNFRIFMMALDGRDIGVIQYWLQGTVAEIDLWIACRRDWNRGHGPAAIGLIARWLRERTAAALMIIRPSARNRRAITAYCKAGFRHYDPERFRLPGWCLSEGLD